MPAFPRRHEPPQQLRRVVVIGAGISGLITARILTDHGHSVVVLDKGRGPGGRASSRRRQGFTFDHGAQYFTARDARFRAYVDVWLQARVVAPWTPRLIACDAEGIRAFGREHARYVGIPAMNAVAKHLARDLEIHSRVHVKRLERSEASWKIENDEGEVVTMADTVVVTVPPLQAVPLLTAAPDLLQQVQSVTMRPCWSVMLGLEKPLSLDFDGAFVSVGALSWVARNSSKPGRDGGEAWVLHASPAWSEQSLEREPAEICKLLRAEFENRLIGAPLSGVVLAEAHRWRYAQPDVALEASCLFAAGVGIGVAGDWCGGPRLEGAFLSGMALAERILAVGVDRSARGGPGA